MIIRVATHLENLGNLEKLGYLRVVREKREKSGKVCSCIWSITASIDLDTKCAKKELFTRYSTVVHHMKSESIKGFSYMQVVT